MNGMVGAMNGTAGAMNGTVGAMNGTVGAMNGTVDDRKCKGRMYSSRMGYTLGILQALWHNQHRCWYDLVQTKVDFVAQSGCPTNVCQRVSESY
jgi:hypothetical protein